MTGRTERAAATEAPAASADSAGRTAAKVAGSATATFALSHLLQQLSGKALWVPPEMRVAVEVFTTLFGTILFLRVYRRPRSAAQRRRRLTLACVWAVAAVLLFVCYLWLRVSCLLSWDPADWKEGKTAEDYAALPEFVDPVRGLVYVPLAFPPEMAAYVDDVSRTAPGNLGGLQWILLTEPDLLFDCLRGDCRTRLWATSVLFLVVHLGTIACVAVSGALAGARWTQDTT